MRRFLLKTLGLVAVFAAIAVALFLVNRVWGRFTIERPGRVLILGASHPECAFNDALIPCVVNFAESGEAYFYTFFKGRKLIDHNPGLERVLIEFSHSAIRDGRDSVIWNDNYLSHRIPTYAPLIDAAALGLLLAHNPRGVVEGLPFISKSNANMLLRRRLDYTPTLGGYLRLDRVMPSPVARVIPASPPSETWATENLNYLDKLVAHARAKDREVIFIRTPVHAMAFDPAGEENFQRLRRSRYGDVEFLDFQGFPLADSDFADAGHLNFAGAERFSRWFALLVEGGLFDRPDKQDFIDENLKNL
jgi:hypothetical protein